MITVVRKVEELRNKDVSFDEDVQLLIRMLILNMEFSITQKILVECLSLQSVVEKNTIPILSNIKI